jgi:dipeptidyl aminopeptidase/acylaminoacyl peptidase
VSEPTRVSREGGTQARWSRDGRELFFVNASQGSLAAQFMSVAVKHGESAFEYSEAIPLFKARMAPFPGVVRDYDVSPDGQRFLVGTVVGDAAAAPATIMLNWMAGLKR